jgi:hypothetical protein
MIDFVGNPQERLSDGLGRRISIQEKRRIRIMSETTISGAEFKKQLRDGLPKLGLFVNAHSATVTEQLAHSGTDWLLIDTQHGPMGNENLSAMLNAVCSGGAKSMVRVAGYHDRGGIQQALTLEPMVCWFPTSILRRSRQAVSCAAIPLWARARFTFRNAAPTRRACWATSATPTRTSSLPSRLKRLRASRI